MHVYPRPCPDDLVNSRRAFEANEPRDLFYRAATELVALAREGRTSLTLAEALAVLLQTWNKAYYRFYTHLRQLRLSFRRKSFGDGPGIAPERKSWCHVNADKCLKCPGFAV
jgi:hypothetical protein